MSSFGFNAGFVDELYARFKEDPNSVSENWREFFADYRPGTATGAPGPIVSSNPAPPAPAAKAMPAPQPVAHAPIAALTDVADAKPLVGIASKIAENMETSLGVPTATSVRQLPVKMLEENRSLINRHQAAVAGSKVSFTHLLAWAITLAVKKHPGVNAGYAVTNGKPARVDRDELNLGLAIDMEKRGERILLVPNIKNAGATGFRDFLLAYDELVKKARANKLGVDDFAGTTITLTNPGMIGTSLSVPRLMAGQSTIIGVGSIGFPAEYSGMSPEVISELGLSKTMTITSTYDHRVIQGAESGAFLKTIETLILGGDNFYQQIFDELRVPHEPLQWSGDQNPSIMAGGRDLEAIRKQAYVLQLIRVHRVRGHLYAHLDPLRRETPQVHPELELSTYGLSVWDLDRFFMSGELGGNANPMKLRDIMDTLRETYCKHIGAEYMHIPFPEQRDWLQVNMEKDRLSDSLPWSVQERILTRLNNAEAFEKFLGTTYVGQKRFSLEGSETLIPMLDMLLSEAADAGEDSVAEAVIGMAHRGRLNVLANIIGKDYAQLFREFEGDSDSLTAHGSGDVKYHLGAEGTLTSIGGNDIKVSVAGNPSHLEAVNPVVEGICRAMQDTDYGYNRKKVLPILLHGDAAFSGQGVVAETLSMSQLAGYRTGGTVHIVVNNQIGFTTGPESSRSSLYATDVAKTIHAPIFHVNGDFPEDAVRVIKLALQYRQKFGADVVIDLICYRRWGHNEGDDPSYTNPGLYQAIENHRSVRKLYTERLLRRGDIAPETAERALSHYREKLQEINDAVRAALDRSTPEVPEDIESKEGFGLSERTSIVSSVERSALERILDAMGKTPDGFQIHPKLEKQLAKRTGKFNEGKIDWALAEALAYGSLCLEKHPVRLSGEDSGRGTFSQRHAVLHDNQTSEPFVPLNHIDSEQAPFVVFDSLLSEFGVLGFEYGYSVKLRDGLTLWEAQFGDFVNGAQVIIDQFISSAEMKWGQKSGLVMLLPHGFEGQGPEHSSARIERFLQLCAQGNMCVSYPSSPAQYFHLLRRQVHAGNPRPLVVFTPKSLLRNPMAVSTAEDLTDVESFQTVVEDPDADKLQDVKRVLLCAGKVFYDLLNHRRRQEITNVAILRVEQYYPYPEHEIRAALERYGDVKDMVWVQEEPRNMGAWDFLDERLLATIEPGQTLRYVGRPSAASPATGSARRHSAEQQALVEEALLGDGVSTSARSVTLELGEKKTAAAATLN